MKFLINGYFDAGFSIGINDAPFQNERALKRLNDTEPVVIRFKAPREDTAFIADMVNVETVPTRTACPVEEDGENHIGLNVPIGAGLQVDLSGSPLMDQWHNEALEAASNPAFMGSYYEDYPENIVSLVQSFRDSVSFVKADASLYGLGVGYLCVVSGELTEALKPYALWIYRCYEYASYGTYSSGQFSRSFRSLMYRIYTAFDPKDGVESITQRKIPCDFFPGYQLLLLCSQPGDLAVAEEVLSDYDELSDVVLDDGLVKLGWAAAILQPTNKDYVSRIVYLLKMAQVFYGICDSFEKLFAYHLSASIQSALSKNDQFEDTTALNKLRTIAHTVTEFTRFDALTQNISDLKLLRRFDELGNMTTKIEHVSSACETFITIQNDVLEHEQANRDKRLNMYAMALTALTVISVMADLLSINDAVHTSGVSVVVKMGVLQLLVIFLIYLYFETKYRRKGRKTAINASK
ncbi:MAG: hypothetical protein BWY72_00646 [Bacteroidetes bacterium ADurb.Bin416]|nr:MAG: hypothetical protein BWY72_00646 [Bacteroidetes bacterium ADurb.Bin416]